MIFLPAVRDLVQGLQLLSLIFATRHELTVGFDILSGNCFCQLIRKTCNLNGAFEQIQNLTFDFILTLYASVSVSFSNLIYFSFEIYLSYLILSLSLLFILHKFRCTMCCGVNSKHVGRSNCGNSWYLRCSKNVFFWYLRCIQTAELCN